MQNHNNPDSILKCSSADSPLEGGLQAGTSSGGTSSEQSGLVIWMYGLSGAGKSTLAGLLEKKIQQNGRLVVILDGDSMRSGLCSDLGFTDADRQENIRRVAQVARLFCRKGFIVLASLITPTVELRRLASAIVGRERFLGVYLRCAYDICARRDVKGLYEKARQNQIPNFTGKDSPFEEGGAPDLILDTAVESPLESLRRLEREILNRLPATDSVTHD